MEAVRGFAARVFCCALASLAVASCGRGGQVAATSTTSASEVVRVESFKLVDESVPGSPRCTVKGTLVNGGDDTLVIALIFRAFDSSGGVIGSARAVPEAAVPPGARVSYAGAFTTTVPPGVGMPNRLLSCTEIDRFSLVDIEALRQRG